MPNLPEYRAPSGVTAPIQVANVSVGALEDGDIIEAGTPIEDVLRSILVKALAPTFSLSGSGSKTVEVGSTINPVLTASYNQRDGGAVTALTIGGVDVTPTPYERTIAASQLGNPTDLTAQVSYGASVDYDDSGALPAGSVNSGTVKYRARRFIFRGTRNATPGTSSDVRTLSGGGNPILDAKGGKQFSISVPDGATSVEFAYPAALGPVEQIQFVGALTSDVTDDYTRTTVTVNGGAGDGSFAIDYYVYRREPPSAYTASTINVTI